VGLDWSTPDSAYAPTTASAAPPNVTTRLPVPVAGAIKRKNSTLAAWFVVPSIRSKPELVPCQLGLPETVVDPSFDIPSNRSLSTP